MKGENSMNIVILVNKDFEYDGYRDGIDSRNNCTKLDLVFEDTTTGPDKMTPSRIYKLADTTIKATEYCIRYMFPKDQNSSNSEVKYGLLNDLLCNRIIDKPDFIISVSTSESTPNSQGGNSETHSVNGCVFLGSRFFARDCSDIDRDSGSHLEVIEKRYMSEEIYPGFYKDLSDKGNKDRIAKGMERVPNKPADNLFVDANEKNTSLGVINVVHYDKYEEADKRTYDDFIGVNSFNNDVIPVGIETTHAVVRMVADENNNIPVLFVSPITDRYLKFAEDVDDQNRQNEASSYNAGVVVANLLDFIADKLQ